MTTLTKESMIEVLEKQAAENYGYGVCPVVEKVVIHNYVEELVAAGPEALQKAASEEDLEKMANWFSGAMAGVGHEALKGAGKALGTVAVGAGASMLGLGAYNVYKKVATSALRAKFQVALEMAMRNQIVKSAPKDRVISFGETIFKFAPNVASDANLLTSLLSNAIHGESLDPQTIKSVVELEGRFTEGNFNPKNYLG